MAVCHPTSSTATVGNFRVNAVGDRASWTLEADTFSGTSAMLRFAERWVIDLGGRASIALVTFDRPRLVPPISSVTPGDRGQFEALSASQRGALERGVTDIRISEICLSQVGAGKVGMA
jgi:hypothetical protein